MSNKYEGLEAYRKDQFAEERFWEPIVINENSIAKIEILEEVKNWDQSKIDKYAGTSRSIKYHKYLVKCPKHNEFFQLIEDDPKPWSYNCFHCTSEEMNRVLQLRTQRYEDWQKKQKEDRRK